MGRFIQVLTTVDNIETARKIADLLVERRLAACVQIAGPVQSVYRWEGKVERAEEWQLIVKTRSAFYKKIEKAIREAHPYLVPEIIAFPVSNGGADYLKWINASTR
jgi:periplasmic divalent cation tolerance protein